MFTLFLCLYRIAEGLEEFKEVITDKSLNFTIMANYSMEEIIRLNIQAYGVGKLESDDDEYIYTNLDGVLRDRRGNPIPKNIENRFRNWHGDALKNRDKTFYAIFYKKYPVQWGEESGYIYFTTCLTKEIISFRAIGESNGQETKWKLYFLSWTSLVEVKAKKLYKNVISSGELFI